MKVSDVITLIQAGYTKAEIELFEKMEDPTAPSFNNDAKPEAPKPESVPETPKPEVEQPNNDKLLDAITGLTKALQVSNIRNTPQPHEQSAEEDIAAKADKALMEIYNL